MEQMCTQVDMCPFSVGLVSLYMYNHLTMPKSVVLASLVHFHRHTVSASAALQTAPWETSATACTAMRATVFHPGLPRCGTLQQCASMLLIALARRTPIALPPLPARRAALQRLFFASLGCALMAERAPTSIPDMLDLEPTMRHPRCLCSAWAPCS